jgi:hypothetical protein
VNIDTDAADMDGSWMLCKAKRGIHPHPRLCTGFRQAVNDCDLSDIRLDGYPFTCAKS